MSELFQLKPCEECEGTGIVLIEKHDCDCPDCLGTGFEEPAKQIMNLERELTAARRLAEKYRNLSCEDQDEADATILPWEK
jgi:RecJ-like exonuclease